MKKLFAILAAALTVFALAACDPENPNTPDNPDNPNNPDSGKTEIPALTLTAANIDVTGLEGDYLAVVDNAAKTIKISLEYADKENARALTVVVENLPEGFTTEYQKTFNYANGATQTVTFKYGEEKAAEYVISVVIGAADPKFTSLTVGGVNAISGTVRFSGATALGKLEVLFTVDPEETVVKVGDDVVSSGDSLSFSDKLNGVTFTLTCGEAVNTINVKAVTSGIASIERVWGHYSHAVTKPYDNDDWFTNVVKPAGDNWLRTVAMDDQYIYLPYHGSIKTGENSFYAPGAYVLSLTDGTLVDTLSTKGMGDLEAGETRATHLCSAMRTIKDGSSERILQCNLTAAKGQFLKVWTWADKDSDPTLALKYDVSGARYGDKFEVLGDWQNGKLVFLAKDGNPGKALIFSVKNGVIDATPTVISLEKLPSANYGGNLSYCSETEVIACMPVGGGPVVYSVSNGTYTKQVEGSTSVFGSYDQSFRFFSFNDQKYLAFVRVEGSFLDGCLGVIPVIAETIAGEIQSLNDDAAAGISPKGFFIKKGFGLGDPVEYPITGYKQINGNADCVVREIGGETYICAVSSCGAGISLFKLKK